MKDIFFPLKQGKYGWKKFDDLYVTMDFDDKQHKIIE